MTGQTCSENTECNSLLNNFGANQNVAERFGSSVGDNRFFREDPRQASVILDQMPVFHDDRFEWRHSRVKSGDHDGCATVMLLCTSLERFFAVCELHSL